MRKKGSLLLLIIILMMSTQTVQSSEAPEFYDLVDSHGSMMIFIDPSNGGIVYANKAAVDFYGYSENQLETMDVYDLRTRTNYVY